MGDSETGRRRSVGVTVGLVTESIEPPARRFLHMCYCCDDTDAVVRFYESALDLKEVMRNPLHPSDGSLLGLEGEIVSGAAFVYDRRGPRTSSSLEVQQWVSPRMIGEPMSDPTHVGMQSLGFTVPDLDRGIERCGTHGASVLHRGVTPWGTESVVLADPFGTRFDLSAESGLEEGQSRLRHLRITVTSLDRSLPWYRGMGFADVDEYEFSDGSFLGVIGGRGRVARLRLPDEACRVDLYEWIDPRSHGRHPVAANTAGLYRTAVGVDDTRASYERFLAEGWTFEREPRQVELGGTNVPDMWICFLNDPDGVPFEFVQRPRSAFRPG